MVRCLVLVFVASTIAIEPATLILACIEDVWTAINLDLNKMCLDGVWMGNVVADNPICGGSSGGTTARSSSQALTEDDVDISVAYCAAYTSNWNGLKELRQSRSQLILERVHVSCHSGCHACTLSFCIVLPGNHVSDFSRTHNHPNSHIELSTVCFTCVFDQTILSG